MKIKNSFFALLWMLAVTAGCAVEGDHFLNEVSLSTTFVSLSMEGGSKSVEIQATDSWTVAGAPQWLTVSPASGSAGSSTITFSAPATLDGRVVEVVLVCGSKTQNINVVQGVPRVSQVTCAEVIAGPEGKTFKVTGICTRISNTNYGNWYLNDGTGEIYIYGTVDASGNYAWSSFNIEVGDEVTVSGPKKLYGSTVELVDATFINVNKSLIKVAGIDPENATLPVEGGDLTVNLTNKGTGIYVEIPTDAKEWLSIASVAGNTIKFHAGANEGGDRSATVVFKTTDGKKYYTAEQVISQKGAIIQVSVADFLAAPTGNTRYRLTGVITRVANKDKGNVYIRDWSGETYVYGIGAKGDFEKLGLKVGDVVTLVGKRAEYKGTPQLGGGQHESHISVTEISIADFLTKEDNKDVYYMVTGTVDEIVQATYGNLYINDGTGNRLYSYGCYPGWGATGDNRKDAIAKYGIKVGDTLTLIGVKATYKGTPQINNGVYFSHTSAD